VQDAEGQTLQFEYDAEGNRTGLLDANGVWTRWRYNSDDEATQKTYSDGSHESWSYNTYQGTLASSTNGRGQTTNYAYDAWQQLKTVDYPQSADVGLTYDALGRAQTMTDGLGTTTWGYDAVGRAAGEDGPWANDTVGYGYDSLDRLSGLSVGRTDGSADVTTLGYDSLSRPSALSQSDGGTALGSWSWSYNGTTDQVSSQTNPNGTTASYGYEGTNTLKRLTSVTNAAPGGATLSRFAYAYDTAGAGTSSGGATGFRDNRVAVSKQYGSDTTQAQTTSYGYTDTSMLRGEGAALVSADLPALSKSYGFDAMGNRNQTTDAVAKTQTNALYNRLNQVTGTSSYNTASGTPVLSSTATYGYDGDGNMSGSAIKDASGTQVGTSIYTYDEASRLVGIETPGQSKWQFVYDGMSRLRVSQVWSWQGGTWVPQPQQEIRRVYIGMDVVQERDVNNVVTASYTRTGNIGGILARTTASSSTFYGYDLSGNVTTLTDNAGAQVGSYIYDAWGNTVASSGVRAAENPYRFSTKESLAGFYSYGFRFYAPGLGRWINRDPIRERGGVNMYAFIRNSPINRLDAYGLEEFVPTQPTGDAYADYMNGQQDIQRRRDVEWRNQQNNDPPTPNPPAYIAINGSISLGPVGKAGAITLNPQNGQLFGGLGATAGLPGISVSVTIGWLKNHPNPTADQVDDFIVSGSQNASGGFGFGGGATYSNMSDGPEVAYETGLYTPQAGVTSTFNLKALHLYHVPCDKSH